MKRLKILNILPFLPWPLSTGGHNGCYHSIEAVKNEVDLIVLFPYGNNDSEIRYMKTLWPEVTWIPYKRNNKSGRTLLNRLKAYEMKLERLLIDGYDEGLERMFVLDSERYEDGYFNCIKECLEKYSIDIVQIEFPEMMSLVLCLPDSVKKIFVHHELRFVKNELILKSRKQHSKYYDFYMLKSRNEEISLLNKYNHVITFSDIDRDKLIKAGVTTNCDSSFLVVDQRDGIKFEAATNRLTFLGSGGHMPNVVGLRWFLESIWNDVLLQRPDIHLEIIGIWNQDIKKRVTQKYKNIVFKGFVDDLYDALKGSIMIIPLTIGSGIRMKILECASLKIPFVSTTVGAEGLPFRNGIDCVIEDDINLFKDKLIDLISDPQKQESMATSSYEIIKKKYSIEALKESRMNIYSDLF